MNNTSSNNLQESTKKLVAEVKSKLPEAKLRLIKHARKQVEENFQDYIRNPKAAVVEADRNKEFIQQVSSTTGWAVTQMGGDS